MLADEQAKSVGLKLHLSKVTSRAQRGAIIKPAVASLEIDTTTEPRARLYLPVQPPQATSDGRIDLVLRQAP